MLPFSVYSEAELCRGVGRRTQTPTPVTCCPPPQPLGCCRTRSSWSYIKDQPDSRLSPSAPPGLAYSVSCPAGLLKGRRFRSYMVTLLPLKQIWRCKGAGHAMPGGRDIRDFLGNCWVPKLTRVVRAPVFLQFPTVFL